MKLETERLYLYPISNDEMKRLISNEEDPDMKQAYSEMLQGCLDEPEKRMWYAVWYMELKDRPGEIAGDFCFKGLNADGMAEIGYGLREGYCGNGYMTEAVKAVSAWALARKDVTCIEAETDPDNTASQKVLAGAGFVPTGEIGEEGPRFRLSKIGNGMRRKDREITDRKEMLAVLDECDTVHLAFSGADYPYAVPLSYGWLDEDGTVSLFFHCAETGMKLDCLKSSDKVCFVCDSFLGYVRTSGGITARYKSVTGFGTCNILKDEEEILRGLRCISSHCGFADYPVESCSALKHTTVCRIDVASMTGKKNRPEA